MNITFIFHYFTTYLGTWRITYVSFILLKDVLCYFLSLCSCVDLTCSLDNFFL
jgi:hypothetical protein